MIYNYRRIQPRIVFTQTDSDFAVTRKGTKQIVTIKTIYNLSVYELQIKANVPIVKIDNYNYEIELNDTGFITIQAEISNENKSIVLMSNTIAIFVMNEPVIRSDSTLTSDADDILSDGTKL